MPTSWRILSLQIIKHEIFISVYSSTWFWVKRNMVMNNIFPINAFIFMHSKQMTVGSGLTGLTRNSSSGQIQFSDPVWRLSKWHRHQVWQLKTTLSLHLSSNRFYPDSIHCFTRQSTVSSIYLMLVFKLTVYYITKTTQISGQSYSNYLTYYGAQNMCLHNIIKQGKSGFS